MVKLKVIITIVISMLHLLNKWPSKWSCLLLE